jgi:hypothetical protein
MKHFLLFVLLWFAGTYVAYAQDNNIEGDSIAIDDITVPVLPDSLSVELEALLDYPSVGFDEDFLKTDLKSTLDLDMSAPRLPYRNWDFRIKPSLNYLEEEYLTITPYSYSLYSGWEGGEMGGVSGLIRVSDKFWINVNLSAMSSFATAMQPYRYYNAAFSLRATYQPNDRIRLIGYGQIALHEGINPLLYPSINGDNHIGVEMNIRVYKNIGVGFGIKSSYYKNNWFSFPYGGPLMW